MFVLTDHYQKLEEAGYNAKYLRQRENVYGDLWNVPCSENEIVSQNGEIWNNQGKKIFKGYHWTERLFETYIYFKLGDGESIIKESFHLWRVSLAGGKINDKKSIFKENKSKLTELKQLTPDEFGDMLPNYVE